MSIIFKEIDVPNEKPSLIQFLSNETWPFHVNDNLTEEKINSFFEEDFFEGSNNRCFWVKDNEKNIGFIRLYDLDDVDDGYPLFDLRLLSECRGKGIGKKSVKWLSEYLFNTYPKLDRIVGTTRADNMAMRKTFISNLFVKEGHFRKDWDSSSGEVFDTVLYSIIRQDWENRTTTPVPWDE